MEVPANLQKLGDDVQRSAMLFDAAKTPQDRNKHEALWYEASGAYAKAFVWWAANPEVTHLPLPYAASVHLTSLCGFDGKSLYAPGEKPPAIIEYAFADLVARAPRGSCRLYPEVPSAPAIPQ
jgi:hypothetical protein